MVFTQHSNQITRVSDRVSDGERNYLAYRIINKRLLENQKHLTDRDIKVSSKVSS